MIPQKYLGGVLKLDWLNPDYLQKLNPLFLGFQLHMQLKKKLSQILIKTI